MRRNIMTTTGRTFPLSPKVNGEKGETSQKPEQERLPDPEDYLAQELHWEESRINRGLG